MRTTNNPTTPGNEASGLVPPIFRRAALALPVLMVVSFFVLNAIAPGGRKLTEITGGDSAHYFGITHSLLFDHDFDLSNEFRRVPPDLSPWVAVRPESGLPGSAFAIGSSLLFIPFLAAGTAVDAAAGLPADGYSRYAMMFYTVANALFTGLGLVALFGFLCRSSATLAPNVSARVRGGISLLATCSMLLATTAGFYAFSPISHASTFLMASLFLRLWWEARNSDNVAKWAVLGLAGGLLSICRWQELVYLGGPLMYDLFELPSILRDGRRRLSWVGSRLMYCVAAAVCWIPQLVEWKIIYGKYFTVPQGDGFIEFPPQRVHLVLFSTLNGWFIWTPAAIIGVAGLILAARRWPRTIVPWLVIGSLDVMVIGCLTDNWWGRWGFGQRYLTSFVPLVAWGVAYCFLVSASRGRKALALALAACCLFTMTFAVQYRLNMVPRDERLTFAELVIDKLRLDRAIHRRSAVNKATLLREQGSVDEAALTVESAVERWGEDRSLLTAMAAIYSKKGEATKAAAAQDRLDRLLRTRLW